MLYYKAFIVWKYIFNKRYLMSRVPDFYWIQMFRMKMFQSLHLQKRLYENASCYFYLCNLNEQGSTSKINSWIMAHIIQPKIHFRQSSHHRLFCSAASWFHSPKTSVLKIYLYFHNLKMLENENSENNSSY